jgi:hypothetical protein
LHLVTADPGQSDGEDEGSSGSSAEPITNRPLPAGATAQSVSLSSSAADRRLAGQFSGLFGRANGSLVLVQLGSGLHACLLVHAAGAGHNAQLAEELVLAQVA